MRLPTRLRPAPRGLTLVELAVVLALVVTLASIAIPSFVDQLARQRVRAAAEALSLEMQETRYAAAQRQAPLFVGFGTGTDWCWSVATTSECDCRVAQACRVKAVGPAHFRGVTLASGNQARFEPDGRGVGSAELVSTRGHVVRVEVMASGRPRLCSRAATLPGMPAC